MPSLRLECVTLDLEDSSLGWALLRSIYLLTQLLCCNQDRPTEYDYLLRPKISYSSPSAAGNPAVEAPIWKSFAPCGVVLSIACCRHGVETAVSAQTGPTAVSVSTNYISKQISMQRDVG